MADAAKSPETNAWLAAVAADLGVDADIEKSVRDDLLNMIAAVAHGPSRPGAPLTAFLVGYAAAKGADAAETAHAIETKARTWSAPES
ncbi:DUF6457 domain-containing protein [Neoactinobaculum massilliense]|uniref:DUF6457 domain-containing protein n=1 Tax=Neoactinobaculum massilliense TaxID=2364794 RepID=UPI000F51CE7A|nr:DUF6457 domain-containing protein [Neoactinobaculum massilliense]